METGPTPKELLEKHKASGEPLSEDEVESLVAAGLTTWDDWDDRGGGLYWHTSISSKEE